MEITVRLFEQAFAVVDVETTGIPGVEPGWEPRIVEIGLVAVDVEGRVSGYLDAAVRQPEEHLRDPRAAAALAINRISVDELLAGGHDEESAAKGVVAWLGAMREEIGLAELRAYNAWFDLGFLRRPPWSLPERTGLAEGECLMLAAADLMGRAGAVPRATGSDHGRLNAGPWKWPRLGEAVAWFNGRGHPVRWTGPAHRAGTDALVGAQIAVAMARERAAEARRW
ncbi:hypothetical protein L6R50_08940 [Myxococcota bacterium]|nr:hypothetical protein [Myxococcota bacterium]